MIRYKDRFILGVDAGNYNMKTQTQCFTSGFTELSGTGSQYADVLEYEGRHYALCDERVPKRDDKSQNNDFLILTMFAMAKELTKHGIKSGQYSIILSAGLPPAHLEIESMRENLKAYYSKRVVFSYNGKRYILDIGKVFVCPQGFAAVTAEQPTDDMMLLAEHNRLTGEITRPIDILAKEPLAVLVDIGGGTVDPIILRYGVPQPFDIDDPPDGIIKTYTRAVKAIRAKTGNNIDESTINMVLNEENVRIAENEKRLIYDYMERYSERLFLQLSEKGLPFSNSYTLLIGGGSKIIRLFWSKKDVFAKLDYIGNIRANAEGFEAMALRALLKSGV